MVKLAYWHSQEVAVDVVQCNTTGGGNQSMDLKTPNVLNKFSFKLYQLTVHVAPGLLHLAAKRNQNA